MAAVQLTGAVAPTAPTGRWGPYRDGLGQLWAFAFDATPNVKAWMSTDDGATWGTTYTSAITCTIDSLDTIYEGNDTVYLLVQDGSHVLHIYTFTLSTHTFNAETYTSGTRPTVVGDSAGQFPAMFVRRSTGEFVLHYQGPLHNTTIRSSYFVRVSSAGVYSAATVVFTNSTVHDSMKGIAIDPSDIVYFCYSQSNSSLATIHLTAANSLTGAATIATGGTVASEAMHVAFSYDPTLDRLLCGTGIQGGTLLFYRSVTGATQTWTADTNSPGSKRTLSPGVAVYDTVNALLRFLYIDNATRDVFQNTCAVTTWTTAAAAVLDVATAAVSVTGNFIGGTVYYLFTDSGVFFDKLIVPRKSLLVPSRSARNSLLRR